MRFLSWASDTTRWSIMSDSMKRLGILRLGHQRAPAVGQPGRHRPAALDRVIDDAVDRVRLDHLGERAVLMEHAVHRVPHADEHAFGQALERTPEVVLDSRGSTPPDANHR